MLIAERGGRTGMSGMGHELTGRCALSGCPRQAGTPQIMEWISGRPSFPRAPCRAALRGWRRSLPLFGPVRSGEDGSGPTKAIRCRSRLADTWGGMLAVRRTASDLGGPSWRRPPTS